MSALCGRVARRLGLALAPCNHIRAASLLDAFFDVRDGRAQAAA